MLTKKNETSIISVITDSSTVDGRDNAMKEYIISKMKELIDTDSPSGYHYEAQEYLIKELKKLGYEPYSPKKGGVIVDLGGSGNPVMLLAHIDTLGAFVGNIKSDGRLAISNMSLNPNNIETENVTIITRDRKRYEGTIQLVNASIHVNEEINRARDFHTLEVVLDEDVHSKKEVEALGIMAGDIVAVQPRFTVTRKGYIKSRFLDDKASAAILLGLAKYVKEMNQPLKRNVQMYFTVFEEIGHGASYGIGEEIDDILSVDMGCVGEGLTCKETMVSICAKDSAGPYHFDMVNELIQAAKSKKLDYAVDVYPRYSSDAQVAMKVGVDARHALIGPGVYASHGYERTHVNGVMNTFELIKAYLDV